MNEMSRWLSSSSFLFWCRKLNCNHCKLQVFCQTFAISVSGDLSSEVSSNNTHEDKVKMFSVVTVYEDIQSTNKRWKMLYKLIKISWFWKSKSSTWSCICNLIIGNFVAEIFLQKLLFACKLQIRIIYWNWKFQLKLRSHPAINLSVLTRPFWRRTLEKDGGTEIKFLARKQLDFYDLPNKVRYNSFFLGCCSSQQCQLDTYFIIIF